MENGAFASKERSKCSIFHVFKYVIFQRHQKVLLWSTVLNDLLYVNKLKINPKSYYIQPYLMESLP